MSTAIPTFSFFWKHAVASCFNCAKPIRDLSPGGYPPGRGAFKGYCMKCHMATWYDCPEGTVEMIDQNERTAR